MKRIKTLKIVLPVAALLATLSGNANADALVMIGISYNFGGETGISFKVLSSERRDETVGAIGVTYFPGAKSRAWGVDTSVGHTFHNGAVTIGYDWLNEQVQASVGAANTKEEPAAAVAPVPAPAPAPAAPQV